MAEDKPFGLFSLFEFPHALRMATITGFHHVAIHSVNFDASFRFYTGVLGLAVKITWGDSPERGVMYDMGDGNYVEVFEREEPTYLGEAAILHFALRTDDCVGLLERVRASGAEITVEPKDVTIDSNEGPIPIKIAFFKGPDGELIELFENSIL